jgi:hypothetical protein
LEVGEARDGRRVGVGGIRVGGRLVFVILLCLCDTIVMHLNDNITVIGVVRRQREPSGKVDK